jgi:hypothetical protein
MRIRIGRHFWEIVLVRDLPGNDGETRFNEGAIVPRQIALRENDSEIRYTLFHEIMHCADLDEGLGLTEKQVLGLERWFKKFEKHQCLCELLDAYGERKRNSSKRKTKETNT